MRQAVSRAPPSTDTGVFVLGLIDFQSFLFLVLDDDLGGDTADDESAAAVLAAQGASEEVHEGGPN